MKKILIDNGLESWTMAIKYCNLIKSGFCTLHYKKAFVSSLHNAIELLLKQIMLDNNDIAVVERLKVKDVDDAQLQLDYYKAKDLNSFFLSLDDLQRNKFFSIEFSNLIDQSNRLVKQSLNSVGILSIKGELNLLQSLRNNETHFYISSTEYLIEDEFVQLHNLMIIIYRIIQDYDLLPYWGEPISNEYRHLEFTNQPLSSFIYSDSVKSSPIAISVQNVLNGKQPQYLGGNTFGLTEQYFEELKEIGNPIIYEFDDVRSIISLLLQYNFLTIDKIVDSEEFEDSDGNTIPPNVYEVINITL